MDFIQELYYGKVPLSLDTFNKGSRYANLLNSINILAEELKKILPDEFTSHIDSISEMRGELLAISSVENYASGFRDGAKIIMDILLGENDNLIKEKSDLA